MPILNYTTKIAAGRTVSEIQAILAKHGALSVTVDYDSAGEPAAVSFLADIYGRFVPFRLPANWQGTATVMDSDPKVPNRLKTEDQARRVAWRIVKDWVEAQMAFIESGQATLAQLFLPHAVRDNGRTFYEEIESSMHLLSEGKD